MGVSPDDIYKYALHIRDDTNEDSIRTVIGRIYYSLYYSCEDISHKLKLLEPPYKANVQGMHDRLIKKYTNHNPTSTSEEDKNIRKLGFMLGQLKSYRTEADYSININIAPSHVDLVVSYSEKLINLINTINKTS